MTSGDAVPLGCSVFRGGTSKGVFFAAEDLPTERDAMAAVLLDVFGSPDIRQIDGLGGATAQTSKAAIIARSNETDVDVDYTFAQVDLARPIVDWRGTCGNLASAVGAYAVDNGIVAASSRVGRGRATVRMRLVNTGKVVKTHIQTVDGRSALVGDFAIPGVPGTGSRVDVEFLSPGATQGHGVLPTGRAFDPFVLEDGTTLRFSLVDAGVPVAFVHAADVGVPGEILPDELDKQERALRSLEQVRAVGARHLGLASAAQVAAFVSPGVPKVAIVSAPSTYRTSDGRVVRADDIDLVARQVSMQRAHQSYAVTGGIAVAAAASITGSVVHAVARRAEDRASRDELRIGHPYGVMVVRVDIDDDSRDLSGDIVVRSATVARTARHILDGQVWVRAPLLEANRGLRLTPAAPQGPLSAHRHQEHS